MSAGEPPQCWNLVCLDIVKEAIASVSIWAQSAVLSYPGALFPSIFPTCSSHGLSVPQVLTNIWLVLFLMGLSVEIIVNLSIKIFFSLWVFLNSSQVRSCYQFPEVHCKYIKLFYCLLFILWLKRIPRKCLMKLVCVCVLVVGREGFIFNLDWLCSHNPYSLASWVLGYQNELNFTALGKLTWDIKLYFEPSNLL